MKIRYLFMTVFVMVSMFDGASFAVNRGQRMPQAQPTLVQPMAEKRQGGGEAIAVTDFVKLSGKVYRLRQRLR